MITVYGITHKLHDYAARSINSITGMANEHVRLVVVESEGQDNSWMNQWCFMYPNVSYIGFKENVMGW